MIGQISQVMYHAPVAKLSTKNTTSATVFSDIVPLE
jgi:hypothetical protein